MKGYNLLYYFLVVLLIMGAFAAMAQNGYGLNVLGGVALAFALIFLIQFINNLNGKDNAESGIRIEFLALGMMSLMMAFRIFGIRFPWLDWLFAIAGLLVILVYFRRMLTVYHKVGSRQKFLAVRVLVFYLSIIFFVVSLITGHFNPMVATISVITALTMLILFLLSGIFKRQYLLEGENVSAFNIISRFKDCSVLLFSFLLIFVLYLGFTRTGILPKLYSDEYPQAFFELVNKAESGKEIPVNGVYRYESFLEEYNRFLSRDLTNKPKDPVKP